MAGDILRLQIETFARITEETEMLWGEVDLHTGIWTLPAERAKNRREHKVMLSRQSIARLQEWKATAKGAAVFPSAKDPNLPTYKEMPMHAPTKNRSVLGIPNGFSSHSTRHAGLKWIAEQGGMRQIRDRLSNHAPPSDGADHIYVSAQLNTPTREWTQRWCDYLAGLEAENVVQIGERA